MTSAVAFKKLVCWTPDRVVQIRALAKVTVLFPWASLWHLVLASYLGVGGAAGSRNTLSCLNATKPG